MRPGENDGLRAALDQIAQGSSRVGHGVGAVADNESVVGVVIFAQSVHHAQPVLRADIGAVQIIELDAIHPAELADVGDEIQ